MGEYGVTEKGFVIKRLDEIRADINSSLKDGWGMDISMEPQSLIGTLVTSFADRIAELWEVAQDDYYAMYPSTAEGENLDNSMQYAGVMRLTRSRTVYSLKCTGSDGTEIPYGALVKSTTQPTKQLQCAKAQQISRSNFREISIYCLEASGTFTASVNGNTFSVTAADTDEKGVLEALSAKISVSTLSKEVAHDDENDRWLLVLKDSYGNSDNALSLSSNLSVASCSSDITFETLDYGDIVLPNGTVTVISTLIDGWTSCTNDKEPISGRLDETDVEARHSYIKRIALRSNNMLSSIASALYNDVKGVEYVAPYENDTDETDAAGRPPHSIEIIVSGGGDSAVANRIWSSKPAGIATYGNVKTLINDEYKNTHEICFSRPVPLYVWFRISISPLAGSTIVDNFDEIIRKSVMDSIECGIGENIIAQKLVSPIYSCISGIDYVEIKCYASENQSVVSPACTADSIIVSARQIPNISADRIEVVLSE